MWSHHQCVYVPEMHSNIYQICKTGQQVVTWQVPVHECAVGAVGNGQTLQTQLAWSLCTQ